MQTGCRVATGWQIAGDNQSDIGKSSQTISAASGVLDSREAGSVVREAYFVPDSGVSRFTNDGDTFSNKHRVVPQPARVGLL